MKSKVRINSDVIEVYKIDNFLTEEECDLVIKEIDRTASRSKVSGGEYKSGAGVSNFRTSSTASLKPKKFPLIKDIDRRMSRAINIPLELGEMTQGQRYNVGQEFKDHRDYFGKGAMKGHGDRWGNRTWTFMIYLNDDCEGGETDFRSAKVRFKPKKGRAVIWNNMRPDGTPNPKTTHAGRPVIDGSKYIITKWFREKPTGSYPLSTHFKKKYPHLLNGVKKSNPQGKVFTGHDDFPKFTKVGFAKIKVPKKTWELIENTYEFLKTKIRPEKFKGQMKIIHDKEKKTSPVDILSLSHVKPVKDEIHKQLQPILAKWSGQNIEPSMMYGIRSYKKGAILEDHKDRVKTHHISCIIIVDRKGGSPWALDIQDHSGEWHKVYGEPGDMILYESATCQHGRLDEFDGEYFRNFFVHYKLTDWQYVSR